MKRNVFFQANVALKILVKSNYQVTQSVDLDLEEKAWKGSQWYWIMLDQILHTLSIVPITTIQYTSDPPFQNTHCMIVTNKITFWLCVISFFRRIFKSTRSCVGSTCARKGWCVYKSNIVPRYPSTEFKNQVFDSTHWIQESLDSFAWSTCLETICPITALFIVEVN